LVNAVLFDPRYIGTAREENALNMLLEIVLGGSIQKYLGSLDHSPRREWRRTSRVVAAAGLSARDVAGARGDVHTY
jgi:hypothetical protein